MAGLVWANPNNWSQQYRTMRASDPGIPAGYVLQSTSDGSIDRAQQTFGLGGHSGQTVLNDGIIDNSRPTFP